MKAPSGDRACVEGQAVLLAQGGEPGGQPPVDFRGLAGRGARVGHSFMRDDLPLEPVPDPRAASGEAAEIDRRLAARLAGAEPAEQRGGRAGLGPLQPRQGGAADPARGREGVVDRL
jgi:hypothetical protein